MHKDCANTSWFTVTHARPKAAHLIFCSASGAFTSDRTQSIHRPPCAIFRVGSRESHPRALPESGHGLCQLLTNEPQTCPMRAGHVRENQQESEVLICHAS